MEKASYQDKKVTILHSVRGGGGGGGGGLSGLYFHVDNLKTSNCNLNLALIKKSPYPDQMTTNNNGLFETKRQDILYIKTSY